MKTITFDEIPGKIMELDRKMDILLAEYSSKPQEEKDSLMTIENLGHIYRNSQPGRRFTAGSSIEKYPSKNTVSGCISENQLLMPGYQMAGGYNDPKASISKI